MTTLSKEEYLKKYLNPVESGDYKKRKKKKKVKVKQSKGMKIFDDDVSWNNIAPKEEDFPDALLTEEEKPQVEVIDNRTKAEKELDAYRKSSKWKTLDVRKKDTDDGRDEAGVDFDDIPRTKHSKNNHTRHDSDSDMDLQRQTRPESRKRHDSGSGSDMEPPRRKRDSALSSDSRSRNRSPYRHKSRHDSDSDLDRPRTKMSSKRDSNSRNLSNSSDLDVERPKQGSRGQRSRHDYDSDSDLEIPRSKVSNHKNRNSSSPKKLQKTKKTNRSRHDSTSDSDLELPRSNKPSRSNESHRNDSDSDMDLPRARKTRNDSDSDLDIPRQKDKTKQKGQMSSGGTGGLTSRHELKKEIQERKKKDSDIDKLARETKANATVFREKGGKKRDLLKERKEQEEDEKEKQKRKDKYDKWGKGLKQDEMKNYALEDLIHESSKPLARYRDDADLDSYQRSQVRDGDPMAEYIAKKKSKETSGAPSLPKYRGPAAPPNRYNIQPGYRWDGVDRSNGFEKKYYMNQSDRSAHKQEAYKWSVEDM